MDAKRHFSRSLSELTKKKSIDEITVTEILENSELSKSTFYNHFKDKYDLVVWKHLSECGAQVNELLEAGCTYRECMRPALCYMYENQQFYVNTMKSKDYNSMRGFIYHTSAEFNSRYLERRGFDIEDREISALIDSLSMAQTHLVAGWMKGKLTVRVDEILELIIRLTPCEFAEAYEA
jgi:AcrR family transcriptional regulator